MYHYYCCCLRMQCLPSQVQTALVVNTVGFGLLEATGKRGSILTASGAFSAYLLGLVLWTALGGWGWGTCVLYLVAGSAVTKLKMAKKEACVRHITTGTAANSSPAAAFHQ